MYGLPDRWLEGLLQAWRGGGILVHGLLVLLLLLLGGGFLAIIDEVAARGLGVGWVLLLLWLLLLLWRRRLLVLKGDVELLGGFLAAEDGGDGEDLLGFGLRAWAIAGLTVSCVIQRGRFFGTYISALRIQSRSSSPSSGPPGPPRTLLKNRGFHSRDSSCLFAASSLCMSSILVFSSVASS